MSDSTIVHLFPSNAPHLTRTLARMMVGYFGELQTRVYIRAVSPTSTAHMRESLSCVQDLPPVCQGGLLALGYWGRWAQTPSGSCFCAYIKFALRQCLPSFGICPFLRLIFGSRRILIHGYTLSLITLLVLRIVGKKVCLIHWGGRPNFGRRLGWMNRLAYRLYNRVYVLMSPETRYFSRITRDKVVVLPYSGPALPIDTCVRTYNAEVIWGNSCWSLNDYHELMARTDWGGLRSIVCMLNYGMEDRQDAVDSFVLEAQKKYGSIFYAWRETLPLDEYRNVMEGPAFYICASKTQTGLGAISLAIRQGKTLILRGDNYQWMDYLGIKTYNLDDLDELSEQTLRRIFLTPEQQLHNKTTWARHFQDIFSAQHWISQIRLGFGLPEDGKR